MNTQEFIRSFEDLSIDPSVFDHQHHVLMTWHYLNFYPFEVAEQKIFSGLTNLTRHLGVYDTKYHQTITYAYVKLIHSAIKKDPNRNWETFKNNNPNVFKPVRELMKEHYSFDVFESNEAKLYKMDPDLKS